MSTSKKKAAETVFKTTSAEAKKGSEYDMSDSGSEPPSPSTNQNLTKKKGAAKKGKEPAKESKKTTTNKDIVRLPRGQLVCSLSNYSQKVQLFDRVGQMEKDGQTLTFFSAVTLLRKNAPASEGDAEDIILKAGHRVQINSLLKQYTDNPLHTVLFIRYTSSDSNCAVYVSDPSTNGTSLFSAGLNDVVMMDWTVDPSYKPEQTKRAVEIEVEEHAAVVARKSALKTEKKHKSSSSSDSATKVRKTSSTGTPRSHISSHSIANIQEQVEALNNKVIALERSLQHATEDNEHRYRMLTRDFEYYFSTRSQAPPPAPTGLPFFSTNTFSPANNTRLSN